jgi:hypothetical protein
MKTVNEIAIGALEFISIYSVDEAPDSENVKKTIALFDDVIGYLSSQGVSIPFFTLYSFTMEAGKPEYTFGLDGASDFAVSPFVEIESIYYMFAGIQYPVEVISHQERDSAGIFTTLTGLPSTAVFQQTSLNCSLNFYPVPNDAYTCYVRSKGKMVAETNQQEVISIPPQHYLFIQLLLAKFASFKFPTADWNDAKERELANLMRTYIGSADMDMNINTSGLLTNTDGMYDLSSIYRGF